MYSHNYCNTKKGYNILLKRNTGKQEGILYAAFEIKLGANQIEKAAADLVALRDSIASTNGIVPSVLCVICGMSNAAYVRPDGVFVVPITALKN